MVDGSLLCWGQQPQTDRNRGAVGEEVEVEDTAHEEVRVQLSVWIYWEGRERESKYLGEERVLESIVTWREKMKN